MKDLLQELEKMVAAANAVMENSATRQQAAMPKVAAGTHRMVNVTYYADVSYTPESLVPSIRCDAEGNPLIAKFQLWHVPKRERPECGAKCRDGHACHGRVVVRPDGSFAKRCRLHGGKSTGPKTAEGRARIAESNRRRTVHNKKNGNVFLVPEV